ncbi:hypothetical protein [Methylobacterium haplocladii]|uniref:hypothetical protein n=1 Tax=Methylobacterium haplocladii TaxID=1176176 RepID=UPI0011BF25CF|nr:hypothetical protein [Methylobacterium haplocladii]GJD82318.1 hypothetical protein HPGCJGGD_0170 [Methylobacterium haplocladii]GLS59149.1 hypothetical protein GCM10007887_18150 [Methylobacterium haplocladii]
MDSADTSSTLTDRLPPETLPSVFNVSLRGWPSEEEADARELGGGVLALAKSISRRLDLSRLEAIVIAMNYEEALASLERGEGIAPTVPTSNEYGQGGAMSCLVVRDDEPWSVVVIWAPLLRQILDPEHPDHGFALMLLVHELVHVDDLRLLGGTFPGGWRAARARDGREQELLPLVHPCASEYSAQRRSAWLVPEHGLQLLEMLGEAMVEVDDQIRSERRRYRLHGDMQTFWPVVVRRLTFLFQALGYGLGHADWVAHEAEEHPELAKRYSDKLEELERLPTGWLIEVCREGVQPYMKLKAWEDLSVYDPLIAILEKLLNGYGMFTRINGDGMYVDMPLTGLHAL